MSGNPFRRQQQPSSSNDEAYAAATGDRQPQLEPRSPNQTPVVKRVRIATPPPLSPDDPDTPYPDEFPSPETALAQLRDSHLEQPPGSVSSHSGDVLFDEDEQRYSADGNDNDSKRMAATAASGISNQDSRRSDTPQHISAPVNPFQRTLASMEASEGKALVENASTPTEELGSPDAAGSRASKSNMDVESFTRMLMTGHVAPLPLRGPQALSNPQPSLSSTRVVDSSSTDTSSVSRQSISEPIQETTTETPRTSYEATPSDDDEDSSPLVCIVDAKKKKPPLPKHRHGKLVTPRAPQIVSFSDFSSSHVISSPSLRKSQKPPAPAPPLQRTSSDLNKPLPQPPRLIEQANGPSNVASAGNTKESNELVERTEGPTQIRRPPPPPLARRSSQMNSAARNRLKEDLERKSVLEGDQEQVFPATQSSETSSITSNAPPPPPARRRATSKSTVNSQNSDMATIPARGDEPLASSGISSDVPLSTSRSSSQSARVPPPPPRPRRSSRTSIDIKREVLPKADNTRRISIEEGRTSEDNARRSSFNSFAPITETSDAAQPSSSKDVLADLSALQAEVDALRDRFR